VSDVSGRQEDRCWNLVALQQWFGDVEIISVSIVEGYDYRPVWQLTIQEVLDQFLEP
jgi:hypothetical protein